MNLFNIFHNLIIKLRQINQKLESQKYFVEKGHYPPDFDFYYTHEDCEYIYHDNLLKTKVMIDFYQILEINLKNNDDNQYYENLNTFLTKLYPIMNYPYHANVKELSDCADQKIREIRNNKKNMIINVLQKLKPFNRETAVQNMINHNIFSKL